MTWQWKDKTNWMDYEKETAKQIEEAYTYFKKGGSAIFSFKGPTGDEYKIDFQLNKQTNQRTNFNRWIRRSYLNSSSTGSGSVKTKNNSSADDTRTKPAKVVPTGVKAITSLLIPKDVWHINNIGDMRVEETDGLPPKIEAPHITLLDSFSSSDRFAETAKLFKAVAATIEPFEIELKTVKYFTHGIKRGFTLYVDPEIKLVNNKNPLIELQKVLYNQVTRSGGEWLEFQTPPEKFTPHVSLGKVSTKEKLDKIITDLTATWQPIKFRVDEIYILSKLVHDTVVRYVIPLGSSSIQKLPQFDPVPFPSNEQYSINVNWVPSGSTDADLKGVFDKTYDVVKAEVVFKTIEHKQYTKGWGNVIFGCKKHRDDTLGKSWYLKGKPLEIFPCD